MRSMQVFGASLVVLLLSVAVGVPIGEADAKVAVAIEPPAVVDLGLWEDQSKSLTCREDSSAAGFLRPQSEGVLCRTDPCFHPLMCASPCTACISGRCR
ncbi:MAG: hypothetical protein AAF657_28140 [Acidobacteriota bacterium]